MSDTVEIGRVPVAEIRRAEVAALTPILPLELADLCFDAGGKRIIDNVNLGVSGENLTVMMGPNGAGKSILLRLLHGLIEPTSGSVLWGGRPVGNDLRKRQALVFQRPVLMRRSVAGNIRFAVELRGFADTEERVAHALERAGLTAFARLPARVLSGGEQQRLAIARALALEPEVLMLDEPTASLDPAATQAIEDLISTANSGGTKIILVTHDPGQARRLAEEIVFLDRGKVSEQTPAKQFFASPASDAGLAYLEGRIYL